MLKLVDLRGGKGKDLVFLRRERSLIPGDVGERAREICRAVREKGDAALFEFIRTFDRWNPPPSGPRLDPSLARVAWEESPEPFRRAVEECYQRVLSYHLRQVPEERWEGHGGIITGELPRPLSRVGVYAPGGRAAYPSSVIMAVAPARAAGVREIALASPPGPDGLPARAVLAVAGFLGLEEIYAMGGAHAVAALAFGTESVRPVEKVVGPGNQWVQAAKREVSGWVGTDALAGPTEVLILADSRAEPRLLAVDLVAQAEHDPEAMAILVTPDEGLVERVVRALEEEVRAAGRRGVVEEALSRGGYAVLVDSLEEGVEAANAFAPEHLELVVEDPDPLLTGVRAAGTVFLGSSSPVAAGDYCAGPNHVLPTAGTARFSSGLRVDDFVVRVNVVRLEPDGLRSLAPAVEAMAATEGLPGHARAIRARLELAPEGLGAGGGSSAGLLPRAPVRASRPYRVRQEGARVKLNTNESPFPLPREILEEVAEEFREFPLHRYPDPLFSRSRAALARFHRWDPEGIWVANGSNECLHHLLLAYGGPGRTILTFEPGYSMYPRLVRGVGGRIVSRPLGRGFTLEPEAAHRAAKEVRPDLVLLSSPNNPTGNSQPRAAVEALLAGGAGMVVVDQAYVEFGGEDLSGLAREDPRVVVVRTFSKAWRLAGVRLGYLLTGAEVTEVLARVALPYHLSSLAQLVVCAALARADLVLSAVALVREERERLRGGLEALGVMVHPSDANFLLVETGLPGREVTRLLEERGVLVRDVSDYPGLERCFRVTVGTREENEIFLEELGRVLAGGLPGGGGVCQG